MRSGGGTAVDRDLVQAFQRGESAAYDEIYGRYRDRVYAICFRMLGRAPEAEEATQETFLRAYQALGRFNGSYHLGAWLGRIAANVCVDALRARSRATLVALPDDVENLETDRSPEEVVVGDHPRLEAAIESIQPLHASALRLRAVQGLSHQEMAHHLAMTPSQVKALLHRARASLRRAWDRVEGMALVPLLFVRSLYGDRNGSDANLVGVAPIMSPALAEKVAASAVVVATVLGGASAPAPVPAPSRSAEWRSVRTADTTAELAELRAAAPAGGTLPTVADDEALELAMLSVDVDLPVDLPDQQRQPKERTHASGDDGDSAPPANGADANEVKREVRRVVATVEEAIDNSR